LGLGARLVAHEVLWDDAAFQRRLKAAAKRKGIGVGEALVAVGANRFYLNKPVEGRSTNIILNLAKLLDVPPSELFGLNEVDKRDQERLRRLTVAARMMVAQLVTVVYLSSSRSEADPTDLMEFVMREMSANGDQPDAVRPATARRKTRASTTTRR